MREEFDAGGVINRAALDELCPNCRMFFDALFAPSPIDHLPLTEAMDLNPCLRTGLEGQ